jgi:hypothetical protein
VLLLALLAPPVHADARGDVAQRGLAWLAHARAADGTYGGYNPVYAAEAAAEAGQDLRAWPDDATPILADLHPYQYASGGLYGDERLAHALGMDGLDPRASPWGDLVAQIQANFTGGQYGDPAYVNDDAWAILGLRAAGVPASDPQVQAAASFLLAGRDADGGWSNVPRAATSDADDTGAALLALRLAGADVAGDLRASLYLNRTHAQGGGHGAGVSLSPSPNCQSTVWALRGYEALGIPPPSDDLPWLLARQDASGELGADGWCTAESVAFLAEPAAGPPSYRSCQPAAGEIHALDPVTLRVPAGFGAATWHVGGQDATGLYATFTLPQKGDVPLALDATGAGVACRLREILHVLTARPFAALASADLAALRRQPVALDASASRDPDGRVALWRVDWGDGNATDSTQPSPTHAYERPGDHAGALRVQDDEGAWSDALPFAVRVRDQPPAFGALPARILADRAHDITLDPAASDPEGDAVTLSWSLANASGWGAPRVRPWALGNFTLRLAARDAWGQEADANVSVEVADLAPTLANLTLPAAATEAQPFAFSVEATDADGPAPGVTWTFGGRTVEGANGTLALPAGAYDITVVARDAEGAEARATSSLVVAARDAPPAPAPPAIRALDASLANGTLVVRAQIAPADANATVRWRSDVGEGETPLVAGRATIPMPDATVVDLDLVARVGGLAASQHAGPLRVAPRPPDPLVAPGLRLDPGLVVVTPPANATAWQVDFGDGTLSGWLSETRIAHAWARPGDYAVRVEARADDGRTSSANAKLTIQAPPPQAPAPAPTPSSTPLPRTPSLIPQESARRETPLGLWALVAAAPIAAALRARARRGRR